MASRVQWIQYNELVVGENHPTWADNDNRPLKQMVAYSNLNPQAEDFPGFIGCYQGGDDPNGVQVGNVRNAFWDIIGGTLWMKQTGDNTDTGWVPINGYDHLHGDGSPEGVADASLYDTTPVGRYYDQQDAGVLTMDGVDGLSRHPSWVKRSMPVITDIAQEWFNGPDDTDISSPARLLDGGDQIAKQLGSWGKVTGTTGTINITSPGTPGISNAAPSNDTPSFYYVNGLALPNANYCARIHFAVGEHINPFNENNAGFVGVGLRFSTAEASGYLVSIDVATGGVYIEKYVAGVGTVLDSSGLVSSTGRWDGILEARVYNNAAGTTATIEAWWMGRLLVSVTDSTYLTTGVPVLYFENTFLSTKSCVRVAEYIVSTWAVDDNLHGWFGENGFEDKYGNLQIGKFSVAMSLNTSDITDPDFQKAGNIAIGNNATAVNANPSPGTLFGNIAIGFESVADGPEEAIAIGGAAHASATSTIAIGAQSIAYGDDAVAIGLSTTATGIDSIALGVSCQSFGINSITVGNSAVVYDHSGIAIGTEALVQTTSFPNAMGIAIGDKATVTHDHCIAIGHGATTIAANGLVIGGVATQNASYDPDAPASVTSQGVNTVLIGWGNTSTSSKPITYRKTNASGTNIGAGDWTFIAGLSTGSATPGQFIFQTGSTLGGGTTLQTAATRFTIDESGVIVAGRIQVSGGFIAGFVTITYSASMTPDARAGMTQVITATNATAFTINAPTNPASGQKLTIKIRNTSGGALGAVTWNAVFKMATWTSPATANSRSITFHYDGTNWVEESRCTTDVPN